MKKSVFILSLLMILGFSTLVQAKPIAGTQNLYNVGVGLVYDADRDITWYAVANNTAMIWADANVWAASLTYGGVSDWRLPTSDTCVGSDCTGSEMGHLYYTELGNVYFGESINIGPFSNLQLSSYWSGTEFVDNSTRAWAFSFLSGSQHTHNNDSPGYALAVHSGNVGTPIPEPSTMLLLGLGLIGVVEIRRKFKD